MELGVVMQLILLGPPGVGKGTQAQRISEQFKIPQISTGDLLREAIQKNNSIGKKAHNYMQKGELVPDDLMLALVEQAVFKNSAIDGFILDGFPRTIEQARCLQRLFRNYNQALDKVILLTASIELITQRLSARRVCRNCNTVYNLISNPPDRAGRCDKCGGILYRRVDDNEATIKRRLDVYHRQTQPLIKFYQSMGMLTEIESSGSPDEIYEEIKNVLGE